MEYHITPQQPTAVQALRQDADNLATIEQKLLDMAEKGDVDAAAEYSKAVRRRQFARLLDQADDDELPSDDSSL